MNYIYSQELDREYSYSGNDLGAVCKDGITTFKLWAPFADKVWLYLYSEGGDAMELPVNSVPADYTERVELTAEGRGIFSYTREGSLHGVFYDYVIVSGDESVRTADPYAVACGCNGCRSMVVDLELTNPEGFSEDAVPAKSNENVIYELHIKDFSYDSMSGIPKEFRGKYKAFTIDNSTLNNEGKLPTCVNYLKELGITHVHLLPCFDYGWLDEAGSSDQFNWGYDPLNFNVPEGSYATNAYDGTVRIREFKEMVQALHAAGIRVVMDVVYNHTNDAQSWLERTAPGYYCRRYENGSLSNGSACGSDLAAGRAMVDNYIVNSVLYWAREYHIDGFRFDLMGLLTTELMNRIESELNKEFGIGEKLIYGEPWRAAESPMEAGTHAALKDNISHLSETIAVFSDNTRDLIKGDVFLAKIPGFVNGGIGLENQVLNAISGWSEKNGDFTSKSCSQIINYVSAHDNFTLWDKLLVTLLSEDELKTDAEYLIPRDRIVSANKLAAFMYFTFRGHVFFQAGEEFGRTKFGDENSYRSHPDVNKLRWQQTEVFENLVDYYKGLIALRKSLPGLYDKTSDSRITDKSIDAENIISFMIDNRCSGKSTKWNDLYVIYNGSNMYTCKALPEGEWEILVDATDANCRKRTNREIVIPACSGLLLGRIS